MRWVARAILAAMILAALYGLWVAPVTLRNSLPLLGHHTRVLWFICWLVVGTAVLTAVGLALFRLVVWCVQTGWPKEKA